MFRFLNADYLYLVFLIVILFVGFAFYSKRQEEKHKKTMGERIFTILTKSFSREKLRLKSILQFLCFFFLILALMRPQSGESQQQVRSQGIELFFVIDVSESMMAEDLKPNRLEQVKLELNKIMDSLYGHKIGLVAFAGSAALMSPLTSDPSAIKMYIDSLSPQSVSSQGTNFSEALRIAKEGFEKGGLGQDSAMNRVILIASDGEDHEPDALKMASELVKSGIRIFTLAYGTERGERIPVRDQFGYLKDFKKNKKGEPIISTVKGDFLKKLAAEGRGRFYFSTFGGSHIKSIVDDINSLEKSEFSTEMNTQYNEMFQYFLIFAFIFAVLEILVGRRRKDFTIWRGRYEIPPR